jgi:hypothetical protein
MMQGWQYQYASAVHAQLQMQQAGSPAHHGERKASRLVGAAVAHCVAAWHCRQVHGMQLLAAISTLQCWLINSVHMCHLSKQGAPADAGCFTCAPAAAIKPELPTHRSFQNAVT